MTKRSGYVNVDSCPHVAEVFAKCVKGQFVKGFSEGFCFVVLVA